MIIVGARTSSHSARNPICASHQVGITLSNLDDGNQYMNDLLSEDIIKAPNLSLRAGRLPVLPGPGLGFEIDWDAVARAEKAHSTAAVSQSRGAP